MQEYNSNARDAHREIGQTRPIEITFPSRANPVYKVRDYGPGITPERMSNVFVLYGASTKRSTNNQTGGFGIGAKSAWSYTDSFEITTYVDGIQRLYVAEIGTNKNGALNKILETETTEPNGTEISIMVNTYDVDDFVNAIIRSTMFWSSEEYPLFKNVPNDSALKAARGIGLARFMNSNMSGVYPGGYANTGTYNTILVIDGIPYPMPYSVNLSELSELREKANCNYLNIFIPNGLVQVGASREKIDDSDQSKKALKQIMIAALADFDQAKVKWEESIVDSQSLLDSVSLMCGFRLTSDKHIDFVHIDNGRVCLQTTRDVIGPEFEFDIVGGKEKRNVKVKQRLFALNGIDTEESKKDRFDINGKNRFYLTKSGNVRISDIKAWLDSDQCSDVVTGDKIDLITILAQQQEFTQDEDGDLNHEYKRNKELADELIAAVERMGFKNIEDYVQKPKEEKTAKPRVSGHLYRLDYSETYVTFASLEDVQQDKPWIYFVGRMNDWKYDGFCEVVRVLKQTGDIQFGFRVTEGRKKKVEEDKRFISYDDFIENYKPSQETILSYVCNSHVNSDVDTKIKSSALYKIKEHLSDKSHPLYKAAVVVDSAKSVNDNWTLRRIIVNTKQYAEAVESIRELNNYIDKYIPFINETVPRSVKPDHIKEYIEWGLAKAVQDGAALKLPKILSK